MSDAKYGPQPSEVCEQRGHELRDIDLNVCPRTYGKCIFCNQLLKWREPTSGYWMDEHGKAVRVNVRYASG